MKLLTVAEAAEIRGVSPRRIRKLCEDGRLKAEKVGRDWLIDPRSLERLQALPPGRPAKADEPDA